MCNPKAEAIKVYGKVGARSLENSFPQEFMQTFPPSEVQSYRCLHCGRPLSHQEMYPPGRMPRYMCDDCYNQIVGHGPYQYCLTCGGALPYHQVEAQRQNPRELKYAFHQGVCWEYHAALAGIVFGIPFKTDQVPMLPYYNNNMSFSNVFSSHRPATPDVIEVKPLNRKRIKYLKLPE